MRKIILFIADSLDGYIARKNGKVDWLFTEGEYGFSKFYNTIDTVVMGRKTYDISLELEGKEPFKGKQVFVFTKSKEAESHGRIKFVITEIVEFTKELLKKDGKNIWLVGGGEIVKVFFESNLIDEIVLSIHPIILGDGIPLFLNNSHQTNLKLHVHKNFDNGLVQLTYDVVK